MGRIALRFLLPAPGEAIIVQAAGTCADNDVPSKRLRNKRDLSGTGARRIVSRLSESRELIALVTPLIRWKLEPLFGDRN